MRVIDAVVLGDEVKDGDVFYPENSCLAGLEDYYGIAQCTITGTATVALQGRMNANHGWLTVATFTASGAQDVPVYPEMRYSCSVCAGAPNFYSLSLGLLDK